MSGLGKKPPTSKPAGLEDMIRTAKKPVATAGKAITTTTRSAGMAPKPALRSPSVVVRVRPFAATGGHSAEGKPVYKRLAKWDAGSIVLEDNVDDLGTGRASSRPQVFTFAKEILGTEATQASVYDAAASGLVKSFANDGFNVLLFAYGQTGTGKTHTIFGHKASWQDIAHEQAGLFPRAVASIFEELGSRSGATAFVLTASAMEFYMCQCTDLLDGNKPCLIGDDHAPLGLCSVPIERPESAVEFMATVRRNRTARSTLMNRAGAGHAGSSRSHCALILTLRQLDRRSGGCLRTTLTVLDMAGAERPSSNGTEHEDGVKAVMAYFQGQEITVGGQGFIVNYKLSGLRSAVVLATEQHRKRRPVLTPRPVWPARAAQAADRPRLVGARGSLRRDLALRGASGEPAGRSLSQLVFRHRRKPLVIAKQVGTSFIEFASGCFSGSALLGMIVTLSPAPACGLVAY